MKEETIEDLLREFEIHVKNNQSAKTSGQYENGFKRERAIETIKTEIKRRVGGK